MPGTMRRLLYNLTPAELSMVPFGANLRKYLALKERDGGAVAEEDVTKGFGRFGKRPHPAAAAQQPRQQAQAPQPTAPPPIPKAQATVPAHPPAVAAAPSAAEPAHPPSPAPAAAQQAQQPPAPAPAPPPPLPPTATAAEQPLDPTQDQQAQVSPQAQAAMRSVARILAPHRGELTMSDLAGLCEAIGIPDDTWQGEEESDDEEYVAMSADYPQNATQVSKTGASDMPEQTAEDIRKEYDSKLKDLEERNERVEKQLQVERDDRERREYVAKAAEFPRVGSAEQRVSILKALRQTGDKEATEAFEAVFKAVEAQLKDQDESRTGVMKEFGSRGGDPANSDDPRGKLNAMAESIVEKASDPLTHEQAMMRVYKTKEGRELVQKERELMAERRRAIG